jgi:hypothetical protein
MKSGNRSLAVAVHTSLPAGRFYRSIVALRQPNKNIFLAVSSRIKIFSENELFTGLSVWFNYL